jgi:hypothetical protein
MEKKATTTGIWATKRKQEPDKDDSGRSSDEVDHPCSPAEASSIAHTTANPMGTEPIPRKAPAEGTTVMKSRIEPTAPRLFACDRLAIPTRQPDSFLV